MIRNIKIKKGYSIPLKGDAEKDILFHPISKVMLPFSSVRWFTVKLSVAEGDIVEVGSPVAFLKEFPEVKICAPLPGTVTAIVRGEKRKLIGVEITSQGEEAVKELPSFSMPLTRNSIVENLLKYGYWPAFRQRPYNTIANPEQKPKALFISCFDTAPLAPNYEVLLQHRPDEFEEGVQVLSQMEFPKIYITVPKGDTFFSNLNYPAQVEVVSFEGPHPAGNVGTHIHFLSPVDKEDLVWHITPQDVAGIGHLFLHHEVNYHKIIAVTGSSLKKPIYWKTLPGAPINPYIEKNDEEEIVRIISGNVLTGTKLTEDDYLSFYDQQVTVIPEGNGRELFGWMYPGLNKVSTSPTFLSRFFPKRKQTANTYVYGGQRALMFNDVYDRVFPMNLLPFPLLRACLAKDWETMEELGIYELAEADVALCEFVCPSKINFQQEVHDVLHTLYKENNS